MADSDETQETKRLRPKSGTPRKRSRLIKEGARSIREEAEVNVMDTDTLFEKAFNGDSDAQNELRAHVSNLNAFLEEAVPVLKRMAVNDHTLKIEGTYEGLAGEAAKSTNDVLDRLTGITKQINEIAVGDTSELEELKRVGKRSEQDHLLPAVINCLEVIDRLIKDTGMLAKAAEEGKLDTRADVSRHVGEYKTIVQGVNDTLDNVIGPLNVAAEYVDRISKGDIPPRITDKYNGDFNEIKNNLNNCVDIMNGLLSETNVLIQATKDGKLDTRGDARKFPGGWGKLVGGVNDLIDAFVHPINVTAEYVDRFSKGEIPQKITDKYNGDFNEIKNCLNACIDGLQGLVEANNVLGRMAVNDHSKGVEGNYVGLFAEVKVHVNEVRDRLRGVTKQINEIAVGDTRELEELKKIGKRSEEDHLLPAIINCLEVIDRLIKDTAMLAKAAEEGKLDTRADLTRHVGEYKTIVLGVNNTLDNVIGPLNVAAEYVDRISKGEIPQKITDKYNGDFNEIKNNLNACIDGLQGLVEANNVLGRMAVNDHSKGVEGSYIGLFAEVKVHVNEVRDRLRGVTKQINEIAVGDTRELEELKRVGKRSEQDHLLPAIINCLEVIDRLIKDTAMLAKAAEEGKLDTRADLSRHAGEYKTIVQGVNNTLDAVIGPLNVAAEYVDRISKGEIPAKITDKYNGDFNEIKNNLNNCIDNINALVIDANMLAKAAVEGKLDTRADASKHQGDYRKIVQGVNDCLDSVIGPLNVAAEYVDRISKGEIPAKITDKYNGDFNEIKNNLNNCIDNINALVVDANMLVKAAVEGKLDTRADATKHQGDYRKIVEGVNSTLDAVIGPLNVAAEYVDRISKGEIPQKITDKYNGDFNEIKNTLNACIDNINALVADANMLAKAAVEGKLKTRADATKHQGDYRRIVEGVNDTLDSVIGPLNVAADYVDKISRGAIPAKITDSYNGDFNVIKNNLNNCIDNINALVSDAEMLRVAAIEGKLATRADATKHEGDYRKIVQGVDDCLDAVIGPLNVAADYVDKISRGAIPAKITDSYNGDFNVIKNNLNNCIDNINALVTDANMLAKAAVEGKLKTRADATKHQGDYRKIVEGVNATLDSVINPVNEALRMSIEFSKCNFAARVDENLHVEGDFIKFKDALNSIGIEVSKAVNVINQQVMELASNAEEANASVEEVASGAEQIAKNAAGVSNNAERGNEGITQVLRAMEDLNQTVTDVAAKAGKVSQLAEDANQLSTKGTALAEQAERGMQSITTSSNEVDKIIVDIKAEMDKIGKIVGLISDLANQTNLLALNAAIEAARAGEAGRGFAVVATEVKSLAQESRSSAENIADMIGTLQKKSIAAGEAVASSNREVKAGSEALSQTLRSFNDIAKSIEDISKNVVEVASVSEEQAATVQEVTASVNEVHGMVQATAKDAMDAAAASEEASASIDQITKVIGGVNSIVDNVSKEMAKFKV
jgi:methyl-accepting chemotaxis protein